MDPVSALCRGCGRTLCEIGGWSSMPETDRRAIMAMLPDRMRVAGLTAKLEPPLNPSTDP